MSEEMVVKKISDFLSAMGYNINHEVPTLGFSADIVAEKKSILTFIEVKLTNWRRGLVQCSNHRVVADFIYLGLATNNVPEALKIEATLRGYGIIFYDKEKDSCNVYLDAQRNLNVWQPQQNVLLNKIRL